MYIGSTNISIPYLIKDTSTKRNMNFLCKLGTADNFKVSNYYTVTVADEFGMADDEGTNFSRYESIYKGVYENFYLKENSIKIAKIETERIEPDSKDSITPDHFMRVYFPSEGIYTYYKNANKFYVSIYTYEKCEEDPSKTKRIYLFGGLLNSYDNLACAPFKYNGTHYQEYQDIRLIEFDSTLNLVDEYLLNITIQPVREENGDLYSYEDMHQGYSIISFKKHNETIISPAFDFINKTINIKYIRANESIGLDRFLSDLKVLDTNIHDVFFRFAIINKYDKKVYVDKIINVDAFEKLTFGDLGFKDWSDWDEGMQLVVYIDIYDKILDSEGQSLGTNSWCDSDKIYENWISGFNLTYQSTSLPITKEDFRFLISTDKNIELDNMNITSYNVVNKLENNTINIRQTGMTQPSVVKPVFFRAYETSNILVHRDIYENICINLDDYKSKVSKFYIKICNNYFPEYSRTIDGVVFKINGACITSSTGVYYICDGDKMFITSGKYVCEE